MQNKIYESVFIFVLCDIFWFSNFFFFHVETEFNRDLEERKVQTNDIRVFSREQWIKCGFPTVFSEK